MSVLRTFLYTDYGIYGWSLTINEGLDSSDITAN